MSFLRQDVRVHGVTEGQAPLVCVANRSGKQQLPLSVQEHICEGLARKLSKHRAVLEEGSPRRGKRYIRELTFTKARFPKSITLEQATRLVRRAVSELVKSLNPAEHEKRRRLQAAARADRLATKRELHTGAHAYHMESRSFRLAFAGR